MTTLLFCPSKPEKRGRYELKSLEKKGGRYQTFYHYFYSCSRLITLSSSNSLKKWNTNIFSNYSGNVYINHVGMVNTYIKEGIF